jgi:hypothetical protein
MLTRMQGKGTLTHFWWECKLEQPLWKTVWKLLKKLKIDLPHHILCMIYLIHYKNLCICCNVPSPITRTKEKKLSVLAHVSNSRYMEGVNKKFIIQTGSGRKSRTLPYHKNNK